MKVELHEGCGRIKLYWTMALIDYRTLKGMIEFKESGSGKLNDRSHDQYWCHVTVLVSCDQALCDIT